MLGIGKVQAITTNEVTYNNNGVEENLTETLDTLYTELKQYKTGGNVTPSEMLEGSSGYSKGVLVTGSIKKKEATTYTPGVNNITIPKGQYLNGNQVILGDSNLKPENIKSGVEIFGIKGSIKDNSGKTLETTNVTNDETYTYLNIPEEGMYNTISKIKVESNKISNNILKERTYKSSTLTINGYYELKLNASQFGLSKIIALKSDNVSEYFLLVDGYIDGERYRHFFISEDGSSISLYLYTMERRTGTVNLTVVGE